jgi:hypothetical protein
MAEIKSKSNLSSKITLRENKICYLFIFRDRQDASIGTMVRDSRIVPRRDVKKTNRDPLPSDHYKQDLAIFMGHF